MRAQKAVWNQGLSGMKLPGALGLRIAKIGIRERRDRGEEGAPKPRVAPIRSAHNRQPLSLAGSTPASDE